MTLDLDELDSHLFKCADIIRDAVDPTDYKEFILPLVYYKTISDEFEKQYEQNLDDYGEDFARNADLYDIPVVPEGHLWDDLRAVSDNVDQALNEAFDALTEENPELKGVFRADYIDADALDDDRLGRLVEHLSKHDLDRESVPPDMLGEAYMDLVRDFAEEEGKSGGQFFTRPEIVELCVKLVDRFEDGMEFHDPTVGSGGMLIEAARYYREEHGGDESKLRFTGQEINPDIAAIARMNLSIHALNGDIRREGSLSAPQFTGGDELERFDRVLANFPFSADWAKDELQDDPYGRFDWHEKLPRADRADYAFIMHMAKQLKRPSIDGNGGKAAIVIPHGVLFRGPESRYREYMLENDLVESIVGLPDNLFQNNSIPVGLLILNTDKPAEREGKVQFINASGEGFYEELSNHNKLTPDGISHIVENFRGWKNEQRVSRTVSLDEIRDNDYNLSIGLYINVAETEANIDVSEELMELGKLQKKRDKIEDRLSEHMHALNYSENATLQRFASSEEDGTVGPKQELPEDWDEISIIELCEIGGGSTPKKSNPEYWEGGDVLWTSPKDFNGTRLTDTEDKLTKEGVEEATSKIYPPGTTLLVVRSGILRHTLPVMMVEVPTTVNQDIKALEPHSDKINPEYFFQTLSGLSEAIRGNCKKTGTTVESIQTNVLEQYTIPVPPVPEQRKIASVLYNIDQAIEILGSIDEQIQNGEKLQPQYRILKKGLTQDLLSGTVRTTDTNIEVLDEVAQHG